MKILRAALVLVGLFLIADGTVVGIYSNFNIGVIAAILWGIFFAACGAFLPRILEKTRKGAPRILRYAVTLLVAAAIALCGFIAGFGSGKTARMEDGITHIMVLGCAVHGETPSLPLVQRLDTAYDAARNLADADIVVSGGQGMQEDISEAEAMKRYLVRRGIDEERIIMEYRSTSTEENFRFTKEILDRTGEEYKVAFVTNDFHVYRAYRIAQKNGIDTVRISAPTKWYNAPVMYAREIMAVVYMWVSGDI